MNHRAVLDLREISRAALIGALGLALPVVFHMMHLGSTFLPMHLPLLAGAFLLKPSLAIVVAATTPLLSGLITGMPPFLPPVAPWMAVELGFMCGVAAWLRRALAWPVLVILPLVMISGRVLYLTLVYMTGLFMELPAVALTVAALLTGWQGSLLILVAVPSTVAAAERLRR